MLEEFYTPEWFGHQSQDSMESASVVVPIIVRKYRPKSVIEFGCGIGAWGKTFIDNKVERYIGVDGKYIREEQLLFDAKLFVPQDLNNPHYIEKSDLCVSLETAEHINEENAVKFVSILCLSADTIVFSAAIPQQSGTNHVNEQWQSYWARIFARFGFEPDTEIREEIWQNELVSWWYIQNVVTYKKVDGLPKIIKNLDVVHPRAFNYVADDLRKRLQERDWAIHERNMARKEIQSHGMYFAFLDLARLLIRFVRKFRQQNKNTAS